MRIGFVSIEDAADVSNWSGTPSFVLRALRKRGLDVELISPLSRWVPHLFTPNKLAARLVHKQVDSNRYVPALRSYARQIERRTRQLKLDLIFSTSSVPITSVSAQVPALFYTDAVFHSMIGYYPAWDKLTEAALRRGRLQEEAALRRADRAVYASEWAAAHALRAVPQAAVEVIAFGSSLETDFQVNDLDDLVQERWTASHGLCVLLFCGVDWDRKGGDIAVETTRLLNEQGMRAELWVIGCQPPSAVPGFVKSFGFISKHSEEGRRRLCELYRGASVFILPTRAEAAGVVFCEASAFGLPILTFDTGGTATYVREGVNGFRLPLDQTGKHFAEAARELLTARDRYFRMSLGGYREYRSRLNWDICAGRLADIFEQVIEERHEGRELSLAPHTLHAKA